MANFDRTQVNPFPSAGKAPTRGTNSLARSNVNRQRRFDARADRRWGEWLPYLELPTPLLWLDDDIGLCLYDQCEFVWPVVVALWP
jgi:hypothetical protein